MNNPNRPRLGIAIMIATMAVFGTKDGIAKLIVVDMPPAQLIWLQFTITFTILTVLTARSDGWRVFLPTPFVWQLVRGLASVGGVGVFYWSLEYLPLADATAMAMIAPIVVTVLSPFLLNEKIGLRRILAALFGFCGVLVILRPGFGGETTGYLIALLSGVLIGLFYVCNRRLGNQHSPLVNIAHSALFGIVLLAPVMPFIWVDVPERQYINFAGFQILALVGQSLLITAFAFGPASIIAPFQHSVIVFVTVVGYLIFGTFPDLLTWVGIAMIVGAGVFIAVREGRVARQEPSRDPSVL